MNVQSTVADYFYKKEKMILLWTFCAALFFTLSPPAWASAGEAPDESSKQKNDLISPALATSVPAAMQGLKAKTIHLVDIRKSADFEQYHIPGSLNISLHAIPSKAYLKNKPVVLVNEGFALAEPAQSCEALNAAGFKATILAGGLLSWKAKGGRLVGDPFSMVSLNRVQPQAFLQEAVKGHYLLVDASQTPGRITLPMFKRAEQIDLINDKQGIARLKKTLQADPSDPFRTLVVCTQDGRKDEYIHRVLARAGIHEFFIIQGGWRACEKQVNYTQLANRPLEDRKFSTAGCQSCGTQ